LAKIKSKAGKIASSINLDKVREII
jgi:hypothetical protein